MTDGKLGGKLWHAHIWQCESTDVRPVVQLDEDCWITALTLKMHIFPKLSLLKMITFFFFFCWFFLFFSRWNKTLLNQCISVKCQFKQHHNNNKMQYRHPHRKRPLNESYILYYHNYFWTFRGCKKKHLPFSVSLSGILNLLGLDGIAWSPANSTAFRQSNR